MNAKLSRSNGILSKIHHYVPKQTLISVYYAIFYSHMTYGSLVWSLTTQNNLDSIFRLQKKGIKIINFASFNEHTNSLFTADTIQFNSINLFSCNKMNYKIHKLHKNHIHIHIENQ